MAAGTAKINWMALDVDTVDVGSVRAKADEAKREQAKRDEAAEQAKQNAADAPLLPRVALREPGAVELCIDRYGGPIYNLARRLCRNISDADDATQDVFVELWRHASRFDANSGSEWTFVLTVARRRLIDRMRRTGRRKDLAPGGTDDSGHEVEAPTQSSPPEAAQLREEAAVATAALDHLSAEQQDVLRLSVFEGMSYPEISERLDMPLGTVKTHARRGLIQLRKRLTGQDL